MSHHHDTRPSEWVVRFAPLVAPGGRVLDLACGSGRHARLFAARGASVLAVDGDPEVLQALRDVPGIEPAIADLERGPWPFADLQFDAIVVTNYLHRPLFTSIAAALHPAGVLLYETFAQGNEAYGRPSNPAFLLAPGELLAAFGSLALVAFEQGRIGPPERPAVVQRLAAAGPARRWPIVLPRVERAPEATASREGGMG